MNIPSFNKRNLISQQTLTNDINNEKIHLVQNKFLHQVLRQLSSLCMRTRLQKLLRSNDQSILEVHEDLYLTLKALNEALKIVKDLSLKIKFHL